MSGSDLVNRKHHSVESTKFILMHAVLLSRKLDSHLMMLIGNLASNSIFFSPPCHTESKAFSASMNTATVLPEGFLLNQKEFKIQFIEVE